MTPSEKQQLALIKDLHQMINAKDALIADLACAINVVHSCPWLNRLDDASIAIIEQTHQLLCSKGIL